MLSFATRWASRLGLIMAGLLLGTALVSAQGAAPTCPICDLDMDTYTGPLAEGETLGLLEALNDEYFAWSIYEQVITDHGSLHPFSNILRAEESHIDMLRPLFEAYALPWADNPWPGEVPSYNSVQAACVAGVVAEVENSALYDVILASTAREDILDVYQRLQRASMDNHLPAFRRCAGDAVPPAPSPAPTTMPTREPTPLVGRAYLPVAWVAR